MLFGFDVAAAEVAIWDRRLGWVVKWFLVSVPRFKLIFMHVFCV